MYEIITAYKCRWIPSIQKKPLLAMKLTLILVMLFMLQASANSYSQTVNLDVKNATLKEVFALMRKQTGYEFLYNSGMLKESNRITVSEYGLLIKDALDICFRNQPVTYTLDGKTIIVLTREKTAFFEEIKITGKVTTKEDNKPLNGVSVQVKGTSKGAITDENGNYALKVNVNDILIFTYLGYDELKLAIAPGKTTYNVQLVLANEHLNEVVVVGYGTQKRSDLTGSSSGINADIIKQTPATTLENAMQGRIAGVNITNTSAEPGGGIDIQIRGITSLSGGNQPLYVIDGVPQYNDNTRSAGEVNGNVPPNFLASLNPSDVASIEVLKDASSASIYGSRGANGVIIITTKKGKAGKAVIDYNHYETMAEKPKAIPLASAKQFATFINLTNTNTGEKPYYDGTYKLTNNKADSVFFPSPDQLGIGTNWQNEIFRTSITRNDQLTISGGGDAVKYLISGNYLADQGAVRYSEYRKGSIRGNIDVKVNEKFSATLSLNISKDLNNRAENSNLSTTPGGLSPSGVILKSFLASPVLGPLDSKYGASLLLQDRGSSSGLINPLMDLQYTINQRSSSFSQSTLDLNYKFSKHFNLTARGAYTNTTSNNDQYWGLQTERGYDYGQQTFQSTWNSFSFINENFLTFNQSFGKFNVNAVTGLSAQTENARGTVLSANQLPVPTENGLYLLPLYKNINIPLTNEVSSVLLSAFGRASLNYDNKYLLTLSGRTDGSSKFAENKKYAFFPSVGLGWNFSEEQFFKGLKEIWSNGKLRGSFGASGNQAITAYQSLAALFPISYGSYNGAATGIITNTSENKDLTWETTKQLDLGLELGFLQNRYRLTFDLYRKITSNLLQVKNIPSESGFNSILSNFGSIRNQGAELEFGATFIKKTSFSWNSSFNISTNRNKILELGEGIQYYNGSSGQADYTHRLNVGGSIGEFWGYQTAGLLTADDISNKYPTLGGSIFEGDMKFVDRNNDGIINDADKVGLGNALPRLTAGLSNDFVYKSWTLNIFMNGVFGNQVLNQNLLYSSYGSYFGVPSQKYLSNYWTTEHKDAFYPRPSAASVNNVTSDRLIESGAYLRIKTVTLRYDLSQLPKWARRVQVYLTASNLFTFTKYDGYDPEVSGYGQNVLTPGIDIGSYPRTRMWTLGLDIGF